MDPCFETATRLARAIRNGRLSSVEATKAHLRADRAPQRAAQRLVVVDRDGAMKAARAADRALAKGKGGRMPGSGRSHGVPITIKEAFDVAGLATTSSHPPLKDNVAREDASLVGPAARGRRGDPGQDQCARTVRRLSDRQPAVRHDQERLGRAAHGRRLDRRRRGRGGGAPVAARARQRHRRLGAQSRALQRHLCAEAHRMARARPRPCARPAGPDADHPLHGRVRPAGALGRGSRDGAAHHRRARWQRRRGRAGAAGTCARR